MSKWDIGCNRAARGGVIGNAGLALALVVLAACSGGRDAGDPATDTTAGGTAAPAAGGRINVSEAINDHMLTALERTYASRNAKVRQVDDIVHVRMDGDAQAVMAGMSDCRVLSQGVGRDRRVMLEYPGGSFDCQQLLSGD